MGILVGEKSETLSFDAARKVQRLLKANAAKQLALLLKRCESYQTLAPHDLKFGTEVETHLLRSHLLNKKTLYPVCMDRAEFISQTAPLYPDLELKGEFTAWMVELLPAKPFESFLNFEEIRNHFRLVDKAALTPTKDGAFLLNGLSSLPHIGTEHYFISKTDGIIPLQDRQSRNKLSQSTSLLDETVSEHARYHSSISNGLARHKGLPYTFVPVLQDTHTTEKELMLDHLAFGAGCAALQVTFSCRDLTEARFLHDMLHVLSPFMLVLSSSTFAFKGRLVDLDNRLKVLQHTAEERSPREMLGIPKSRFNITNHFISNSPKCSAANFNDARYAINKAFKRRLAGLLAQQQSNLAKDCRLLNHFAYLFVRDYLTVFPERVIEDNVSDTVDFELMQTTNWQTMRFKPPPAFDSQLGWMIEFRCMDCPVTEREKSSLVFMLTLLRRIISDEKLDVDFYMPISQVDENFEEAFKRNSLVKGRFKFRRHFSRAVDGVAGNYELVELTLAELLEGKPGFAGLKRLIEKFIELNWTLLVKENCVGTIWQVYEFFVARAKGEIVALSEFMRAFVLTHPCYKKDSVLNDDITTDVIEKLLEIQKTNYQKEMFGYHMF